MEENATAKIEQLKQAIAAQEGLRGTLDDAILDATIAALRSQLSELERAQESEQQRKLMTVLFMDVVGSTELLRGLDPEENLAIMDSALQELAKPVESLGGRVLRFMGDGYLAVFGLPRARENDPEMAVRAGLAVLEIAQRIAGQLEEEYQLQGFQVRIGVNTGLVVAGGVTEGEGTLMGPAVNLAARLESSAPPGGLLISQDTYQHVRGLFDVAPREAIEAKGFAEPVQVYLVTRARPRVFRPSTRGVEGVTTPMVGREEELGTLQASMRAVLEGQGSRFVTVLGEAGLGKSRLLEEFENWLEIEPVTIELFKGRATLESMDLPYSLLRDLIANRFGILDDDSIAAVRKKILTGFNDAIPENENMERNAHFVGQLLGYDFRDSPYLQGVLDSPRQIHDRALVYIVDYFKSWSAEHPLAIFLDDIHWADDSSLDVIAHLFDELSDGPFLFIALSRPALFERRLSWGEGSLHQKVDLEPLSRGESQNLVEAILRNVQDVPDVLRDLVIENAEGNPFYLEELVRMLVEDEVIVKGDPHWRVRLDRLVDIRIPPTLTGVLQARLEGLPRDERRVLQQASVIGRVFWDQAVLHIDRAESSDRSAAPVESSETKQNLETLQIREMIFEQDTSAFSGTAEYLFKHAVLRDVTYETVLKRVRRTYHAMVADWLLALSGEMAWEVKGLIAGHLEKAGKRDEALEHLRDAAEAAVSNYAVHEAVDFYSRALALVPEDDLDRRYPLLLGMETAFDLRGDRVAQREALDSLASLSEALEDDKKTVEVMLRSAWFEFWTSDFRQMKDVAAQAIALAEAAGDQRVAGQAHYAMAWAVLQLGDLDQGLHYAESSLSLARQAGDRRGEGNSLNVLGMIENARGDYAAAREHLLEFLAFTREIGDMERESTALNNLGVALTLLGDFDGAREKYEQHLKNSEEMNDRVSESTSKVNLAWVTSAQGEYELARDYALDGIAIKKEVGQIEAAAEGLMWLGHAWLGLNQPEKATAAYQEALEIRRELHQSALAMGAIAGLARAAWARGESGLAREHAQEIASYFGAGGTLEGTWEPLRIYLTCFQIQDQVGDLGAEQVLENAFDLLQQRAARIPAGADRRRFIEQIPWHHGIMAAWEARRQS